MNEKTSEDLLGEIATHIVLMAAQAPDVKSGDEEPETVREFWFQLFERYGETMQREERDQPIPMRLHCPECHELHLDEGDFATKPHHTHACQGCGNVWRPAVRNTVGVRFLPGFKNDP